MDLVISLWGPQVHSYDVTSEKNVKRLSYAFNDHCSKETNGHSSLKTLAELGDVQGHMNITMRTKTVSVRYLCGVYHRLHKR